MPTPSKAAGGDESFCRSPPSCCPKEPGRRCVRALPSEFRHFGGVAAGVVGDGTVASVAKGIPAEGWPHPHRGEGVP